MQYKIHTYARQDNIYCAYGFTTKIQLRIGFTIDQYGQQKSTSDYKCVKIEENHAERALTAD